jgi:antirestriction protein
MTATETTTPAVWIGSLYAYNCGSLVGEWTDASDLDQLREVEARVLKRGGGEEIALMDFEGFGDLIGEYTPLDRVAEIAAAIEEHGEALLLYAARADFDGEDDLAEFIERFESAHAGGGFESLKDYAEDRFHELFEVPDALAPYINYDAFENTLDSEGVWFAEGHVFSPV